MESFNDTQKNLRLQGFKNLLSKENVNRRSKAGVHASGSSVDIIGVTGQWRKLHSEKFSNINIIQAIK